MTLAVLCSGQGTAHAGMFDLSARALAALPVFEAAAELLGSDPREWVHRVSQDQLYANQAAQLLCCTQGLAAWAALDLGARLSHEDIIVAGYSIGELAAWGCAQVFAVPDVLRLALERARAMDQAAGADTGLASVRGLSRIALHSLCSTFECELAIILASDSFIVGGRRAQLQQLCRQALQAGAVRAVMLPIAVASHTSRLRAASAAFRSQLRATSRAASWPSGVRLLSGLDADVVTDLDIGIDKLARQISQTLDWSACLTACGEAGATRVLELGPGRALASMAREAIPQARCRSIEEFRTLEGVRAWLTR
jgi:[acyl-carrier-protein] S-malonyltransferase